MRWVLYICCMLFLFSCETNKVKKPEKPENLIPKDKMIDILYDMSVITASKGVAKRILEREGVNPETFIFEKHNIDSLQFEQSNRYYSHDLELYESLYRKVEERVKKDKEHYSELAKEERDSIKKNKNNYQDSLPKELRRRRDSLNKSLKVKDPLKKADTLSKLIPPKK